MNGSCPYEDFVIAFLCKHYWHAKRLNYFGEAQYNVWESYYAWAQIILPHNGLNHRRCVIEIGFVNNTQIFISIKLRLYWLITIESTYLDQNHSIIAFKQTKS